MNEGDVDPSRLTAGAAPMTARRSRPASSPRRSRTSWPAAPRCRRPPNDLHHQAPVASPAAQAQCAWLYPPRLRGLGLDPLRRLRPRLHLGLDHPGLLRAGPAAAPDRQALGHRLLLQDAGLFPRQLRTASTPSTGACPRC